MAKPKQASDDQPEGIVIEDGTNPLFKVEDSKPVEKEAAKPQNVTELPNGIVIEDY